MIIKFIIFYIISINFVNSQFSCNKNIKNLNINSPIICTENGWVRGARGINFPNVTFFKGIPFASPPINELRWKEPQKVKNWNEILDCNNYGSVCPQPTGNGITGSEDCLFLNIFKPTTPLREENKKLLPVYVWIHGGACTTGSSSNSFLDGEYLASKGIIYVSINYRLGSLGFMAHKALREDNPQNRSGNYGLLDQIYALNWIKRNILEFGGDLNQITIGGQSAGGVSVYLLSLSPLASNLFKGVICESGGAMHPRDPQNMYTWHYTVEQAENKSANFLSKKNINNKVTAKQLRELPLDKIIETDMILDKDNNRDTWVGRPVLFHPILDEYVISRTYEETIEKGLQNKVNVLMGYTFDEMGASPSLKITLDQYQNKVKNIYGKFSDEFISLYPASPSTASFVVNNAIREMTRISYNQWANLWLKNSKLNVFQYSWSHAPPGYENTTGAYHTSEITYFLNTLYMDKKTNWNENDKQIADIMSSYVLNFIKTFDPNGQNLPKWDKQKSDQNTVMEVGNNFKQIPLVNIGELQKKLDFFNRFWSTQIPM